MTQNNTTDDTYLFIVSYTADTERKRAEYLFNNWEEGDIETPDGFIRIASDVDHDELYERLVGKVPAEQVQSYRLEPVEANVERERHTVEQEIAASPETVESFLEYILSKKKAVLQSAARNEYEVYTKKGRADVSYQLTESDSADGNTSVTVVVEGYQPAPQFLTDFFETELNDYAKSQQ